MEEWTSWSIEGEISVTYLDRPSRQSLSVSHVNAKGKVSLGSPSNKLALLDANGCDRTLYYYEVPYFCGSGLHGPGDSACALTGTGAAGYATLVYEVLTCGDTSGGGGGGTTPIPPGDYNPCGQGPPVPTTNGVGGSRGKIMSGARGQQLMVHENPDCNPPSNPADEEPEAIDPNSVTIPENRLCSSTFVFSTVVAPDASQGSRGWKEAAVAGLYISVNPSNLSESIWSLITQGSVYTSVRFDLTVGVPGDLPNALIAKQAADAANIAAANIEKRYGSNGMKTLINSGLMGMKIAQYMQAQLAVAIPGCRVSSSLSGRTPPHSPVSGYCQ